MGKVMKGGGLDREFGEAAGSDGRVLEHDSTR